MLYLITGSNGAGKTLNALKWVRERSVKEGRPVCHNGRFEIVEGGELSSWKKIDFKDWQDEPDGTIFFIDECHNDLQLRAASSTPPEYVRMLAEHRRRGFDFYLISQHPQNIDSFVRRLIGAPGWHRHLKRTFGADLVSCLEWPSVNPNCEKDGSAKSATVTMVPYPKEVYGWYKSASLHTGKKRIPKQVWVFLACLLIAPALAYYGFKKVTRSDAKNVEQEIVQPVERSGSGSGISRSLDAAEYVATFVPRVPDYPHTAPRYDEVTKPVTAPYPAACLRMRERCECYSQQGTKLLVSADACSRIVRDGYFVDWQAGQAQARTDAPASRADDAQALPRARAIPQERTARDREQGQADSQYLQALAARNAQVRSTLQ